MYSIQEQFKSDALAQLNSKVQEAQLIAGNMLDLSREIGVLNLRTTKASAELLAGAVQKLLAASNPAEFFQLAASVMRPDMQVWISYTEQLYSIAGKIATPVVASPASAADDVPASGAAQEAAAPDALVQALEAAAAAAEAVGPGLEAAAAAAATIVPAPEAALEAAPEAAPEAAAPKAGVERAVVQPEPSATAGAELPLAASSAQPEMPEAIQDVADALAGVSKAPPVVIAASALPSQAPAVPEASIVPKDAIARTGRRNAVQQVPQNAGSPGRSGANRGRK